jgi:hypothetical protein
MTPGGALIVKRPLYQTTDPHDHDAPCRKLSTSQLHPVAQSDMIP